MKFSILTPSFNQASFLERNIQSVLAQDTPDVEHIIFDGNSIDGTVDILKRYSPYLAYWTSEPDRGQADALCKALAKSTGDVIGWLNVDEYYDKNIFGAVCRAFEQNPKSDVVYGDHRRVFASGQTLRVNRQWRFDFDVCRIQTPIMISCSTFFRREKLLACGGFDPSWHFLMDWELYIRFMRGGTKWVRLKRVLGNGSMHELSKTATNQADFNREVERLRQREFPGLSAEDLSRLQARQIRRMKWHMLLDGVIFEKIWFKAFRQRYYSAYFGDPGTRIPLLTPFLDLVAPVGASKPDDRRYYDDREALEKWGRRERRAADVK